MDGHSFVITAVQLKLTDLNSNSHVLRLYYVDLVVRAVHLKVFMHVI